MAAKKLFASKFLNKGSKGPAVTVLQFALKFEGYARKIEVDGDYGDETWKAVKKMQRVLGFTGKDVDGHFGPATRQALFEATGLDVNDIDASLFTGKTNAVVPE